MRTVAVDFDGVLNTYQGWAGEDEYYQPRVGAGRFLVRLSEQYRVVVYTTRDVAGVWSWLLRHGLHSYVYSVSNEKPRAIAYIDDRAVRFDGDYDAVLERVADPTHWERTTEIEGGPA